MALEHEGDVDFDFRQAGSYILKRSVKECSALKVKKPSKTIMMFYVCLDD